MRRARRRMDDERGAVLVMASIALVLVISSVALAVDVGHVAWSQRDLQRVADAAALDSVRALGERRVPGNEWAEARSIAETSAARNGLADPSAISVTLGVWDPLTRAFDPLPSGADASGANAVVVRATNAVDHRFMPGTAHLSASGVAASVAEAGFTIGSRTGRLSTSEATFESMIPTVGPLIGAMLGTDVDLDIAGYKALAGASISSGALLASLDAGSPGAGTSEEASVSDVFTATVEILNDDGDEASVEAANELAPISEDVSKEVHVAPGFLADLSAASAGAGARAQINVLDLLLATATAVDGDRLVVADLPVNIPGVASARITAGLVESPRSAAGPALQRADGTWVTSAHTAQARVRLDLTLSDPLVVAGTTAPVTLPLWLGGGRADATLTGIACPKDSTDGYVVIHATTSALGTAVGEISDTEILLAEPPEELPPAVLAAVPGAVTVRAAAHADVPGSSRDLGFVWPWSEDNPPYDPDAPPSPQRISSRGVAGLGAALADSLDVSVSSGALGVSSGAVRDAIRSQVAPVLDAPELDTTVSTILWALGLSHGGADVDNTMLSCGGRRLVG